MIELRKADLTRLNRTAKEIGGNFVHSVGAQIVLCAANARTVLARFLGWRITLFGFGWAGKEKTNWKIEIATSVALPPARASYLYILVDLTVTNLS